MSVTLELAEYEDSIRSWYLHIKQSAVPMHIDVVEWHIKRRLTALFGPEPLYREGVGVWKTDSARARATTRYLEFWVPGNLHHSLVTWLEVFTSDAARPNYPTLYPKLPASFVDRSPMQGQGERGKRIAEDVLRGAVGEALRSVWPQFIPVWDAPGGYHLRDGSHSTVALSWDDDYLDVIEAESGLVGRFDWWTLLVAGGVITGSEEDV